ncbi:MAG: hypothetical protein HC819_16780 [Cyclobacteriaceae bacterium]|nr:hypothetical protein [Cyclobacteriaceae bacterium]
MKRITLLPQMLITAIFLVATSCNILDDEPKAEEYESTSPYDVFAQQSQQELFDIWEKDTEPNSSGRIEESSSEDDEFCDIPLVQVNWNNTRTVLTVNFSNFRCEPPEIVRNGGISLTLVSGESVEAKNSVVKVTYTNFTVTDTNTGKYVEYNGERFITNLSGGKFKYLKKNDPPVVHKVRSYNFKINYNGTGEITENTARYKVLDKINHFAGYQMTIYPDTVINGMNVADWGTLKNGKPYYHIIHEPIVYQSCARHCRYINGVRSKKVVGGRETFTVFGVTAQGEEFFNTCLSYGRLVYYFNSKGDSIATVIKHP